jgi:hypothetical protein
LEQKVTISQYTPLQVAYTIMRIGKRLEDIDWDELNETWLNYYASDRRYRINWCSSIEGHAIFRIGKLRVIIEQRVDGCIFARWICNDIAEEKACWKVTPDASNKNGYTSEWQDVIKI